MRLAGGNLPGVDGALRRWRSLLWHNGGAGGQKEAEGEQREQAHIR
ncbi:hypothetical protein CP97_00720 [Aurantiacibacter atlanticus]|uniref:Uncharacterized protein n=1 Tax=Aurantiacibacter atlanticus TaxID=1648404 RepID=A0A0H4VF65_9SPHN|nr:hypothetical protein CP97_00720 [Aurantiacibacter atlanticus]